MPSIHWQPINASVVLLANVHNPSIINHDFLKNTKIVGADWELATPPVITPVIAQINYKQNISWVVTSDQCIITEQASEQSPSPSNLYESAQRYTEVLEHIPYTAIGLNWHISIAVPGNSNDWVKSKLLKSGAWKKEILSTNLEIKMHSDDSSVFSLFINTSPNQNKNIITIGCNFNFDLQNESNKTEKIAEVLSKHLHYQEIFHNYLKKHFFHGNTQ